MATTVRVEKNKNFTIMSNYHLRDKSLSLKAKGLLSYMLSLPETWDYTISGLTVVLKEGRDGIRAAVKELEDTGYIQRQRVRKKNGCLGEMEYIVREEPVSSAENLTCEENMNEDEVAVNADITSFQPASENPIQVKELSDLPMSENPTLETATLEKATQINTNIINTNKINTKEHSSSSDQEESLIEEQTLFSDDDDFSCICQKVGFDELISHSPGNKDFLLFVKEIIKNVCTGTQRVVLCKQVIRHKDVIAAYRRLTGQMVENFVDLAKKQKDKITNICAYTASTLYMLPLQMAGTDSLNNSRTHETSYSIDDFENYSLHFMEQKNKNKEI